jgi:hypothetical protein
MPYSTLWVLELCQQLLGIEAVGGCDATFAVFDTGNAALYKHIIANSRLKYRVAKMQQTGEIRVYVYGMNVWQKQ